MSQTRRRGIRFVFTLGLAAVLAVAATADGAQQRAAKPGELRIVGIDGRVLARAKGMERADGFGTAADAQAVVGTTGGGMMIGAPLADGGAGRVQIIDMGPFRNFRTVDAADLGGTLARFGRSVEQIGHIDNAPGVHFAVGAPGDPADAAAPTAVVILHQVGLDYVERQRIAGPPGSAFGHSLEHVDFDFTDSIIDHFAVGAPRAPLGSRANVGAVSLYDSQTGALIWTARGKKAGEHFGWSMYPVRDIDGDDIADLLVGAPGTRNGKRAGQLVFLSGASGRVIRRVNAPKEAGLFGYDVERDFATGDLVAGAPATSIGDLEEAGAIYLIPGDGSATRRIDGTEAGGWLGEAISTWDLDDDGDNDIIGGERARSDRANKDLKGRVVFYDPLTLQPGVMLMGKRGGDHFGSPSFRPYSDYNRDGSVDFIVSMTRVAPEWVPE